MRRLSLHVLPPGFTKIRHYGILGNNQRARQVPLARVAACRQAGVGELALALGEPTARARASARAAPEPARCPRCGSDELTCVGRLDLSGRFTGQRRGALRLRLRTGEPCVQDSS